MAVFSIIPTSEMTERFDAEFYTPNFLVNDKKLKSMPHKKLSEILQSLQLGYTGPTEKFYEIDGINYLSSKNIIDGNIVITDATDTISTYAHRNDLKRTSVQEGDVLISRTGSVGKSAIVTRHLGEANIAAHLIALRIKKGWDSYYLSAFLNSFHGRQQSQRHQRGTIIQGLSVYDVPLFYIPLFTPVTQKYIGDKVRQAEELRAWAERSVARLKNKFSAMYEPLSSYDSFEKSSYPIQPEKLFEVLTPASYPPHIEKYFENNLFITLGEICSAIYTGKTLPSLDSNKGVLQATSRSCSGLFLKRPMNIVENKSNVDPLKKKDIILTNAAHDKNYIGKDVSFNHSDDFILPSAKVIVIRVNSKKVPVAYVHSYLMTSAGYTQWQSIVRGISAGIHPSDVASRIRIPLPNDELTLASMAEESDRLYVEAGLAQEISRLLTTAARILVEALIEGQLTEEQLIKAQQALEDGDNTLDKAILSKLSSEGYAVEGAAPLFSDIDELYRLLASATPAADSED